MIVTLICVVVISGSVTSRRIVDLTHTYDNTVTKWPLNAFFNGSVPDYFKMTPIVAKDFEHFWLEFNYVEFFEHAGTHMDAPVHFARGRQAMHEIPAERLIGPGVVVNVEEKVAKDHDYSVTVQDLKDYEEKFGRIPKNAIVMMNSGWAKNYPNPEKVFGTQMLNDSSTFHFPGWGLEAVKMLLTERQVSIVGSDSPSAEHGQTQTFPCHVFLNSNNVPLLEYVANLDNIPQNGTTIFVGSIKTRGGTGGAIRLMAVIEDERNCETSGTTRVLLSGLWFVIITAHRFGL